MTQPMPAEQPPDQPVTVPPAVNRRIVVDAGRFWAGAAATALVAGLIALLGVVITQDVANVKPVDPVVLLGSSDNLAWSWFLTAVVAALLSAGLLHILLLTTPRPRTFFVWIVLLVTAATVILPFAGNGHIGSKAATAVINLLVGIAIATLLYGMSGLTTRWWVPEAQPLPGDAPSGPGY